MWPENASLLICSTLLGITMLLSNWLCKKVSRPMLTTPQGMWILFRLAPAKALSPILTRLSGSFTYSSQTQFSNMPGLISLRPDGSLMLRRDTQRAKARGPISIRLSGMAIEGYSRNQVFTTSGPDKRCQGAFSPRRVPSPNTTDCIQIVSLSMK